MTELNVWREFVEWCGERYRTAHPALFHAADFVSTRGEAFAAIASSTTNNRNGIEKLLEMFSKERCVDVPTTVHTNAIWADFVRWVADRVPAADELRLRAAAEHVNTWCEARASLIAGASVTPRLAAELRDEWIEVSVADLAIKRDDVDAFDRGPRAGLMDAAGIVRARAEDL